MSSSTDNSHEHILSSDNSHYLHHTFFEPKGEIKATLLIVHGMMEHSGRYSDFAQYLADNGIAVATYDQLGHGQTVKSSDELGFFGNEHPMQTLLKDVIIMADALKAKYPDAPHFIMGHSMGSFIVRTVLKHHANAFAGAILMGSADHHALTHILLPINALLAKAAPKKHNTFFADVMNKVLNSKLNQRQTASEFAWLSENVDSIKAYEADPLTGFDFTNNGFLTLFSLMQAGLNKQWANTINKDFPMLFVSGENDPIGDMGRGIRHVVGKLRAQGFSDANTRLYPNMRHEPLHEQHNNVVYRDLVNWLRTHSAK